MQPRPCDYFIITTNGCRCADGRGRTNANQPRAVIKLDYSISTRWCPPSMPSRLCITTAVTASSLVLVHVKETLQPMSR